MKQRFNNFAELTAAKTEGTHYKILIRENSAGAVAIVAPHGGRIEHKTSEIAQKIAANDHSLYLFRGLEQSNSFFELHLESHNFDEPRCVALVAKAETVITIHGCQTPEPVVYLGGRDQALKLVLKENFNRYGIKAEIEGHPYQGNAPQNICNRGSTGRGVQLEFSRGIRTNPQLIEQCVQIVRAVLKPSIF
jgi:phage replication-related protein YjqB (UPF0714/DUF867 family)